MADRWEIQGFIVDYGDGRPAWSVGVDEPAGVIAYLATVLDDTDAHAWLIRRGPQIEAANGTAGPWRLVAADARERLARHLYVGGSPADWRGTAELAWNRQDNRINRDAWLNRADELLAVISGKD